MLVDAVTYNILAHELGFSSPSKPYLHSNTILVLLPCRALNYNMLHDESPVYHGQSLGLQTFRIPAHGPRAAASFLPIAAPLLPHTLAPLSA